MNVILSFSITYICEGAFSSTNAIKTKNQSKLKNLENDMGVCLSAIQPQSNLIMKGIVPNFSLDLDFYNIIVIYLFFHFNKFNICNKLKYDFT